ncbi:MAG TPA: lipase family protein [Acidimicrobiales bacterium]|nr:lipase family protein [Acidimicrobiales bacterium]
MVSVLGAAVLAVGTLTQTSASAFTMPGFYSVPAHIPKAAGTVIKSEKIADPGVDATTYRVMYVSRSVSNQPVPVTGLIFVPHASPPSGGYPVVSWGHGTDGMADVCAPSLNPSSAVPEINLLLQQGWVVTASDYQGLGTPGLLPYLVGEVAARNTIDIVRAAHNLKKIHASANYVVWGHSEGGQTAMFSLHIGAAYAPDLHLKGVVAGAPPSQFNVIYDFLKTSPYRFYLFMAAVGYQAGYGPKLAPLSKILTKAAIKLEPVVNKGCFNYLEKTIDKYSLQQMVKVDPFGVPAWKKLLAENDPSSFTTPVAAPLLIYQGGADEQIPVVSTQILATQLCAVGQDLERWIYPGRSHTGVIAPASGDMVHWITDRFAGDPNPDPYQPIGQAGVMTTTCP